MKGLVEKKLKNFWVRHGELDKQRLEDLAWEQEALTGEGAPPLAENQTRNQAVRVSS